MVTVVVWYTVVLALIVSFVTMTILVNHNVILKYSNGRIKRFFAHPLLSFTIRRTGSAFISVFLAVTLTFFLLRIYDPSTVFCTSIFSNKRIPIAIKNQLCQLKLQNLGMDSTLFSQYLKFLFNIIPFPKNVCITQTTRLVNGTWSLVCTRQEWKVVNLGVSAVISVDRPVSEFFASQMPWSFYIGLCSMVVELLIGYPMGVFMAKYKNKWFDKLGNAYIILAGSIPSLVYFYLLQALFVEGFHLPLRWSKTDFVSWIPAILTIGLSGVAGIALWVRRYMVDEFGADYIKFARAKGVPENTILFKHVLRNAAVPLVRSIPAGVLYCLLGSYFVEKIYFVEGFGQLLVNSIQRNDYPIVQAVVLVSAIISIVASLIGDITTAIVDPRVTFSSK